MNEQTLPPLPTVSGLMTLVCDYARDERHRTTAPSDHEPKLQAIARYAAALAAREAPAIPEATSADMEATSADDFAKIIRAADGAQVLYRKGTDENGDPCLYQATCIDGVTAEIGLTFKTDDWDKLNTAFANTGEEQANELRAQIKKLIGEQE